MADYSMIKSEVSSKVSNWEKPGGKLGFAIAALAAGGGAILLYNILPWLITLASNMLTLGLLVIALSAIAFVLCDKSFRENFSMVYFMIMRKIAGIIIEIDPIAIVEHKLEEMRDKIEEITSNMSKIKGLITRNKQRVAIKKNELAHELELLAEYKRRPDKAANAKVSERQVERLTAAVKRTEQRLKDSEQWLKVLEKLKERAELVVKDTENEVQDRKEEYESIKAQHAAFSNIMSIIKGNPNDMVNFTRAMDFMADDIAYRLGEMSDVIDGTSGLLDQIEVEDALTSAKAAKILEQFEKGGIDSLFSSDKPKALEASKVDYKLEFTNVEEQVPVEVNRETEEVEKKRTYFS